MKTLAFNICVYQITWFLCVFLGNHGALLSLPLLILHLFLLPHRKQDLQMMGVLLLIGLFTDGILHLSGMITFTETGVPIPIWLMVIWLALALLPHHSLRWLKGRPILSSVFGALGGPPAYWAGVKAGAAEFSQPLLPSLLLLGLIWAIIWPTTMQIADRLLPAYSVDEKKNTILKGGNP